MEKMGDDRDVCLKTKALLLPVIYEKFRSICLEYCSLDPCSYFRSTELKWDTVIKKAGVKVELISDINIYLFIERGKRVGISKKISCVNKKNMKDYDS